MLRVVQLLLSHTKAVHSRLLDITPMSKLGLCKVILLVIHCGPLSLRTNQSFRSVSYLEPLLICSASNVAVTLKSGLDVIQVQ